MERKVLDDLRLLDYDAVVEQFLTDRAGSPHTRRGYSQELAKYKAWAAENNIHPLAVDHRDVNRFLETFLYSDRKETTKARRWAALSSFFDYLSKRQRILSPFTHPEILKPSDVPELSPEWLRTIPVDDHAKLMRVALQLSQEDALQLLLLGVTGLKLSELLEARVEHVDQAVSGWILLVPSREIGKEVPLVGPLRDIAAGVIDDRSSGPLIRNRAGHQLTRGSVTRTVKRAAQLAKVDRASPQLLRNTAGVIAISEGVSIIGFQDMLGVTPRSVTRYMAHAAMNDESGASRVLRRLRLEPESHDVLSSADRFLSDPDAHPIAPIILAGTVLEQHLREMCAYRGIAVGKYPSIEKYKGALVREGALSAQEGARIDLWKNLRNSAAHGSDSLTAAEAEEIVTGVRSFISTQ